MTTWVKICGLTDAAAVAAALDAGADAVGFVLFVPKSPRNVEPPDFLKLSDLARQRAKVVVVTADPTAIELDVIIEDLEPDAIQLHGRETPDQLRGLSAEFNDGRRLEIWKALAVGARADLITAADYDAADWLLLDAKPPKGADRTGGHGAPFDWSLLAGWAAPKPWILSGGLTPDTVAEAIRITGATAVDVSSGVESAPGVKDPAKIAAFIAAAKAARPAGAVA